MIPELHLWQAVVYKALLDATADDPAGDENLRAKKDADRWLRAGGRDFRQVVTLAGMDPDFVREAYISGRVDPVLLRRAESKEDAA